MLEVCGFHAHIVQGIVSGQGIFGSLLVVRMRFVVAKPSNALLTVRHPQGHRSIATTFDRRDGTLILMVMAKMP